MSTFNLHKQSMLPRDILFQMSTDISNFHNIIPEYFKFMEILDDKPSEKLVLEYINFLGIRLKIKTKHFVVHPNIHNVLILSGPLKGTTFSERYEPSSFGTNVDISVNLKLNGILKLISFIEPLLITKMNSVMTEFIICSENYTPSNLAK